MRSFAVLPLLAVFLVSLCGSQVPPPPSDVSGVVYFDANHNGMHDSCDRLAPGREVVVFDEDGEVTSTGTDRDGMFRLEVPHGSALISIGAPEGQLWPTSTRTADGRNGVAIDVGTKDVSGIELGIVTKWPVSEDAIVLAGIIFNDRDRDGEVDRDECGIKDANGSVGNESGTYPTLTPNGEFVVSLDRAPGEVQLHLPHQNWISSDPGLLSCLTAMPRQTGERLYEVRAGFVLGEYGGSITGSVFHDSNGNHLRDPSESAVADVSVDVASNVERCPYLPSFIQTHGDGTFVIEHLPPGDYYIRYMDGGYFGDEVVAIEREGVAVTVSDKAQAVSIPLRIEPGAFLHVVPFDDANGNGLREATEGILGGVEACATNTDLTEEDLFVNGNTWMRSCSSGSPRHANAMAIALGPLRAGQYFIALEAYGLPAPTSFPENLPTVALGVGSVSTLEIPIDVLSPDEQLVHDDPAAVPVEIQDCYKDPGFSRRPFEEGYDSTEPLYGQIDEGQARNIYEQNIFVTIGNRARYVFFEVAGIDRNAPGIRDCAYDGSAGAPPPHFWIAGYDAMSALRVGWTYEVMLRNTGAFGLESLSLPITYDRGDFPSEPWWVVFVDESFTPIARCSSGGCETF